MICLALGLGLLGFVAARRARCHHHGFADGHHYGPPWVRWHGGHHGRGMLFRMFSRIDATPTQERAIIHVDTLIDPRLSRTQLQMDPVISKAKFFRNNNNITGTVFYVDSATADALDRAIGFAPEVARKFLDEVSAAEQSGAFDPDAEEDTRQRELRAIAIRQGQPAFRRSLLQAYEQRCAVTDTDVVCCLEAAHILPYVNEARNHVSNGILLRADVHALFDLGLLAIARDHKILIAPSLRGTEFGQYLAGRRLRVPNDPSARPSDEALERHRIELATWASI